MDEQREQSEAIAQRFGVMNWWGVRSNRAIDDRMQRFQQLTSGLHRACSDACRDQLEALTMANDCVSRSFEVLLRSTKPDEIFAVESETLSGLMKVTSLQMKAWSDFGQKIQSSYIDAARGTTTDIGQETRETTSEVEEQVQQTIKATRQRFRRGGKEASGETTETGSAPE